MHPSPRLLVASVMALAAPSATAQPAPPPLRQSEPVQLAVPAQKGPRNMAPFTGKRPVENAPPADKALPTILLGEPTMLNARKELSEGIAQGLARRLQASGRYAAVIREKDRTRADLFALVTAGKIGEQFILTIKLADAGAQVHAVASVMACDDAPKTVDLALDRAVAKLLAGPGARDPASMKNDVVCGAP